MAWVKVAGVNDIASGKNKCSTAGGKPLAVFNVGGKFFVIDNTCTHPHAPPLPRGPA